MTPFEIIALITEFTSAARAAGELVQHYTAGLDQIGAKIEQHERENRGWLPEEIQALRAELEATRALTLRKIQAAEATKLAGAAPIKRA